VAHHHIAFSLERVCLVFHWRLPPDSDLLYHEISRLWIPRRARNLVAFAGTSNFWERPENTLETCWARLAYAGL